MTTADRPDAVPAPAARTTRSVARWVGGTVSTLALLAVVVVALALIVVPLLLGATPYTVLTGSMRPTLPPGELVVTRPRPAADITLGDVITYQLRSNEPEVVTHRVVGVGSTSEGERTFITRGDANNLDDDPVRAVQVRGVVVYHVPYLGHLNSWVGVNRPGWLLKGVAAALILYGLVLVGGGLRDRLTRRHAALDATEPAPVPEPVLVHVAPAPPRTVRRPNDPVVVGLVVCAVSVVALAVARRSSAPRR
ncbi:signal peptidase I [Cellulomonas humilata]|uniref:Signal peptidase I n=1 Tax=Cellulomonas humilata TaxID=144055 RepID=A0A7Y6DX00_9CELL|nr:signal peptidase I [Cellulomonas humilata]